MKERNLFDKSYDLVQQAMENVIQEVLIELPDGTTHIVYITKLKALKDGGIEINFNTPSEDRKPELYPIVEKCIQTQIEQATEERKRKLIKWW